MDGSSAAEIPAIHKPLLKQSHALQFPLDDVTILQRPADCPRSWFNRKALKNLNVALNLGQIVSAIVILALTRVRDRPMGRSGEFQSFPEAPYIFLAINAMAATFILLGDSLLTTRPLRCVFTPTLWFQVQLWFTGCAALMYHVLAYYVLITSLKYYGLENNTISGAFGFVAAALYLVDWYRKFSKRHYFNQESGPELGG